MARKTPKRRLIDACTRHLLIKKIAETLDSSDTNSSNSEGENPVIKTLLKVTKKRYLKSPSSIAKTSANLDIYMQWKFDRPDLFRVHAR